MNRRGFRMLILGLFCSLGLTTARADFSLYSNTTNFSGLGYANGGATRPSR